MTTNNTQLRAAATFAALADAIRARNYALASVLYAVADDYSLATDAADLGRRLAVTMAAVCEATMQAVGIDVSLAGQAPRQYAARISRDTPTATEVVQDCLALVGVFVHGADLDARTQDEREEACDWAGECIMAASDHGVVPRTKPAWLPEASAPPDWWVRS